jgi:hypothetical protein
MNGLKRFGSNVVATLPECVPAALALAVGNRVQFFLIEVHKA